MTFNPDELREHDDSWASAPEPDASAYGEVPKGTYQAFVERAYIDPPGEFSDYPRLRLTCKIIGGDHAGRALFPDGSFDPKRIQYLKALVYKMGLDPVPDSAVAVGVALPAMLDRILEIAVVPRKDRPEKRNYYVNRFVSMMGGQDEPPPHTDNDGPRF